MILAYFGDASLERTAFGDLFLLIPGRASGSESMHLAAVMPASSCGKDLLDA
jgi:hypothetical protein